MEVLWRNEALPQSHQGMVAHAAIVSLVDGRYEGLTERFVSTVGGVCGAGRYSPTPRLSPGLLQPLKFLVYCWRSGATTPAADEEAGG